MICLGQCRDTLIKKKLEKGMVWFIAQGSWSDVPHPDLTRKLKVSEYACLLQCQRAKG